MARGIFCQSKTGGADSQAVNEKTRNDETFLGTSTFPRPNPGSFSECGLILLACVTVSDRVSLSHCLAEGGAGGKGKGRWWYQEYGSARLVVPGVHT